MTVRPPTPSWRAPAGCANRLEAKATERAPMWHTVTVWLGRRLTVDPSSPDHIPGAPFRVPGGVFISGGSTRRYPMANKLFVGALSSPTPGARRRGLFAGVGGVESAAVVMDRETGRSRGFGFVEMATAEEADAAGKKYNGQEVDRWEE